MNEDRSPSPPALRLEGVTRRFETGDRRVTVLEGLNLTLERGERVAVTGASGCGKSTLLNVAAGMDRPDAGRVDLLGRELSALDEPELTRYRARRVGLVFQDFNLIESLSVRENIALPLWLNQLDEDDPAIERLAATLDIADLLDAMPARLSGGEKQRVAIARALVHAPELLLADEPTGSLDEDSAERVLALFDRVTAESGCALVLVTHNPQAAAVCDRRLALQGGRLHPTR